MYVFFAGANSFKGTISLKAPLTSRLEFSEQFFVGKIPWRIRADISESDKTYVGLFLNCADKNVPFEHDVNFAIRLISSTGQTHGYARSTRTFSSTKLQLGKQTDSWGCLQYIRVSDLSDEKKGLMVNGIIKAEVEVKFVD